MTRLLIRYSVAVMTTLLGLAILWQFRTAVMYVVISVALTASLRPLVTNLAGKNLFRRLGWILLYLGIFSVCGYLLYLAGKIAFFEVQQLASTISMQDQWQLPAWLEHSLFKQVLDTRLLPPNKLFQIATYGQAQSALPAILGFTQSLAGVVSGAFIIIILSLYWMVGKAHFERLWLSLLPSGQRKQARDIWQTTEPDLGAYIRNQVIINILAGILLALGYWLIGSPYPMLLALAGAFVTAIPYVGVILAVILPLVVGVMAGLQFTPYLVLYTIVVMIVLDVWVKPRIHYRRWDNPILTLVLLVALADAFGLVGIIIAPPLAAITQIIWSVLVAQRVAPEGAGQIADIKIRQERIWATIKTMEDPPPHQVTSTMERLDQLIIKAEPMLQTAQNTNPRKSMLPKAGSADQE